MSIEKRPKHNLKITFLETVFASLSLLFLIGTIVYIVIEWSTLPSEVPIHFGVNGEADGWGPKWAIWGPVSIGLMLWIGFSFLAKMPEVYNYLVTITEENASRQYRNARMLIYVIQTELSILFALLSWKMVHYAHGDEVGLGFWEFPIFLIVLLGTISFFIARSVKLE
ncbi:DUF1648 domain-containing protein [Bacillus timonensis]|nr:DUF1648 domain-containing protein [Bacillus timonensis]